MKITQQTVTDDVKSAVNAYLITQTYAEAMRKKVDKVDRETLLICPLFDGRHNKGRQIKEGKDVYLCLEEEDIKIYYAKVDQKLKEMGIKPANIDIDHCPALIAESNQSDAGHILIRAAAEMLKLEEPEEFANKLICYGMEKYREFITLVVKLVVKLPGYQQPKCG